jgi:hypothetical protein
MRKIGNSRYTQVVVQDEPNEKSKACHSYAILDATNTNTIALGHIHFQEGPIKESGVNGAHNEDLLAIVIDRLYGFQNSEFKCRENAIAITKIEEALLWLGKRTSDRESRGVEGTNAV